MDAAIDPWPPKPPTGARLCRFYLEDRVPIAGFFEDDYVIPVSQAANLFAEDEDVDLILPISTNLLDLLPPDGLMMDSLRSLSRWLQVNATTPEIVEITLPLDQVRLLTPIARPPKILLLAGNYSAHVAERGGQTAERDETFPYVFMKPSTTLNHPGCSIVLPRSSPDHVDWECELGIVIGRKGRHIPEAQALEYVAGYTVINDVSDRKYRPNANRKERPRDAHFDWQHGKWHNTFCPVGPCVLPADLARDPQGFRLKLSVNGDLKQDGHAGQMVFPVAAIIAFISEMMTLEPGDLIATGTPAGVGSASGTYLRAGDKVVAEISGIGRLENPVRPERGE